MPGAVKDESTSFMGFFHTSGPLELELAPNANPWSVVTLTGGRAEVVCNVDPATRRVSISADQVAQVASLRDPSTPPSCEGACVWLLLSSATFKDVRAGDFRVTLQHEIRVGHWLPTH